MPKLTIDLPDKWMPVLTEKAAVWKQTPEGYLASFVVTSLEHEEKGDTMVYTDPAQQRLEEILEERDKGPFIEITRDYDLKGKVMARVKARLEKASAHA